MKKFLLILSLLAVALAACSKQEQGANDVTANAQKQEKNYVTNQFDYKAANDVVVVVSEFTNDFNEDCVVAHAKYMYGTSKVGTSCIRQSKQKNLNIKNEVVKQFVYKSGETPIQVTMIKTSKGNACTIAHVNYMYDTSAMSVNCS